MQTLVFQRNNICINDIEYKKNIVLKENILSPQIIFTSLNTTAYLKK